MDRLPSPRKQWKYRSLRFFLICTTCLTAAGSYAQEKKITFLREEMSVREAIGVIEQQAGVYFGYSTKLEPERKIRLEPIEMEFDQAVGAVIGEEFEYIRDGQYILIYPRQAVPLMYLRGRIVEGEEAEPVRGAFIEIAGQAETRVRSGKNGVFEIEGIPEGYCIVKITHPETGRVIYREAVAAEEPDRREFLFREIVEPQPEPLPEVEPPVLLAVQPADETHRTYRAVEPPNAWVWKSGEFREYTPGAEKFSLPVPKIALKTNALYWALSIPNAAVEIRAAERWTAELSTVFRPDGSSSAGRKIILVQPEARFWPRGAYEQFFFGLQATWGSYRFGYLDLPFPTEADDQYLDGTAVGAGLSIGYHYPLGKRWGIEFSTSLSYLNFHFDKYKNPGEEKVREVRHYFGPAKVGISIQYVIR